MKKTKKLNLDAFKLSVKQNSNKVAELMGGQAALANCHPDSTITKSGPYHDRDVLC